MTTPIEKLSALGLSLPIAPAPAGNYLPYVRTGNTLYLAGTLSILADGEQWLGKVGESRTVEDGYAAARSAALNALASLHSATDGDLSKVRRIALVNGFVNAVAGFSESPAVINGASDFFAAVFGDSGRHARAAVAVAGLPKDATVEIQVVAELF
jgi:enamine deaminase RidA (YjgF/YER057c/UK114 family)